MKKILVIGSTGMLGMPVTSRLIESGFDITLLLRKPLAEKDWMRKAKIAKGDVFNRESLETAI